MPTVKEHVRNLLDDLPDDISWEQLQHEIWVMEETEKGLAEIERGETIPHAEVVKEFKEWVAMSNGLHKRKEISGKSGRTSRKIQPLIASESPAKYSKKSR